MTRLTFLLLVVFAFGCTSEPEPAAEAPVEPQRYELRGKILQLRTGDVQAAVIEHQEIVGFMDAMTMTFPIPDAVEFAKIQEGDYISADVIETGDGFHLENIELIEEPAAPEEPQQ